MKYAVSPRITNARALYKYDNFGNVIDSNVHNNAGNACYYEYCRKPTMFINEKVLNPYTYICVQTEKEEPSSLMKKFCLIDKS